MCVPHILYSPSTVMILSCIRHTPVKRVMLHVSVISSVIWCPQFPAATDSTISAMICTQLSAIRLFRVTPLTLQNTVNHGNIAKTNHHSFFYIILSSSVEILLWVLPARTHAHNARLGPGGSGCNGSLS